MCEVIPTATVRLSRVSASTNACIVVFIDIRLSFSIEFGFFMAFASFKLKQFRAQSKR
jgi:hypothetical protein